MTDILTQEQIDALKFKCENAIENEEVSQATWPLSEQDTSEVQTTLYAHDVLELIKEVEFLRKATSVDVLFKQPEYKYVSLDQE